MTDAPYYDRRARSRIRRSGILDTLGYIALALVAVYLVWRFG